MEEFEVDNTEKAKILGQFLRMVVRNTCVVNVCFNSSPKEYAYLTDIRDLIEGDKLAVETKTGEKTVIFKSYSEKSPDDFSFPLKWILYQKDDNLEELS